MNIAVDKKSKKITLSCFHVMGPTDNIVLLKFYRIDMLKALKRNIGLTKDVIITFPTFTYYYSAEYKDLYMWTGRKAPVGDDVVDYTVALKFMTESRESRRLIRQFNYLNRKICSKGY